jgi:hypothetical protein
VIGRETRKRFRSGTQPEKEKPGKSPAFLLVIACASLMRAACL